MSKAVPLVPTPLAKFLGLPDDGQVFPPEQQQPPGGSSSSAAAASQEAIAILSADEWEVKSQHVQYGDKLGQGGFGTVYQCTLRGIKCAAKKVTVTTDSERAFVAKTVRNEFRALQKAKHANIVGLMGVVGDDAGAITLLMELAPLGSLRGYLDAHADEVIHSWLRMCEP